VYDLYETGYRDITAITASIATKLVSQRNEVNLACTENTVVFAALEPSKKKLKMTRKSPLDSTTANPDDYLELLYIIDSAAIN
jgi:hypothetical protein